jgi:hypothetical protein
MSSDVRIQIAGKTYTAENLHEITDDPTVDTKVDHSVHNHVSGEFQGIQARDIRGDIHFG